MLPPSESEALTAYVALAVAAASLLLGIWKASWGTRNELDLREKRIMEYIEDKSDKDKRMVGETIAAARLHADLAHQRIVRTDQKLMETELWGRDHYAKREDLVEAVNRFDRKLDAIGAKLDGIIEKRHG